MDDVSQFDHRLRRGLDCSAAECLPADQTTPSEVAADSATHQVEPSLPNRPFVWQDGRRLLLLEREPGYWILAELEFEPDVCRYSEVRRAFYRWEREAVGALLSRSLSCGDRAMAEVAELLAVWSQHHRRTSTGNSPRTE